MSALYIPHIKSDACHDQYWQVLGTEYLYLPAAILSQVLAHVNCSGKELLHVIGEKERLYVLVLLNRIITSRLWKLSSEKIVYAQTKGANSNNVLAMYLLNWLHLIYME